MQHSASPLGLKIKRLREDRNISREQMADHLEMSKRTYEKIESGERGPTVSEAGIMAKHFGVEPEDLLYREPVITFNNSNNNAPFNSGTVHFQTIEDVQKLYDDLFQKERELHQQLQSDSAQIIEQQSKAIERLTGLLGK